MPQYQPTEFVDGKSLPVNRLSFNCRPSLLWLGGVMFCCAFSIQVHSAAWSYFSRAGSYLLVGAVAILLVGLSTSLFFALRKSDESKAWRNGGTQIVPALAIIASLLIPYVAGWLQPTENVTGAHDEGIYANASIHLANEGRYAMHAKNLSLLPPAFLKYVIEQTPATANRTKKPPPTYASYHPGLFVLSGLDSRVAPQFPVGYSVWLGSFYHSFGFAGLRWSGSLLLLLTAFVAATIATNWLGRAAGIAVLIIWVTFPLHLWMANSFYAEALLQLFWLLAVWGLSEEQQPYGALLSGMCVGLASVTKIEALPVAFLVCGWVWLAPGTSRHTKWLLAAGLITTAAATWTTLGNFNHSYTFDHFRAVAESVHGWGAAVIGITCLTALGMGMAVKRGRAARLTARHLRGISTAAGFCFLIWALYVWRRSGPSTPDEFYYWPERNTIRSWREDTFIRLGWYLQPWGLSMVALGVAVLIARARRSSHYMFLFVGLLFLGILCWDIRNYPAQPYAMRRLVPYALPLLLVGAASVATSHWLRSKNRMVGPSLVAALCAGFIPINKRLNSAGEYQGLRTSISHIAGKLPPNGVTLVWSRESLASLATPLEFIYDRPVLRVHGAKAPAFLTDLCAAVRKMESEGLRTFILTSEPAIGLPVELLASRVHASGTVSTSRTRRVSDRLNTTQEKIELPWTIFEIMTQPPPGI